MLTALTGAEVAVVIFGMVAVFAQGFVLGFVIGRTTGGRYDD